MSLYHASEGVTLYLGDAVEQLATMPDASVSCVVTSPPYFGLRDYGVPGQIGLEPSPAEYVEHLRAVFAEVRRVLRPDGVLWLNLGDSYYSGKGAPTGADDKQSARRGFVRSVDKPGQLWAQPKNLLGIPWRVAFALQDAGWTLRNAVIWDKPNAMPSSVSDRLSNRYEHLFLFSKSRRYWFNLDAIREPHVRGWTPGKNGGRGGWDRGDHLNAGLADAAPHVLGKNPGDVWTIAPTPYKGAHFATMPHTLVRRCLRAGCPPEGVVLDPFVGSGTSVMVARELGHPGIGIDLNPAFLELAIERIGLIPQERTA